MHKRMMGKCIGVLRKYVIPSHNVVVSNVNTIRALTVT